MIYTPDEKEVTDVLNNLLEEMIKVVHTCNRVINSLDNYIKTINKDSTCNVQKIIQNSEEFSSIREEIMLKIKNDFVQAEEYVRLNYEKCRPIFDFKNKEPEAKLFLKDETRLD
jgi:hypothetical protein